FSGSQTRAPYQAAIASSPQRKIRLAPLIQVQSASCFDLLRMGAPRVRSNSYWLHGCSHSPLHRTRLLASSIDNPREVIAEGTSMVVCPFRGELEMTKATEAKKLTKQIKLIEKTAKGLAKEVHECATGCLVHAVKHGDTSPA